MTKTTIKDGVLYREISKQLYIQHKKDGWTDRRIMQRYGMHNVQMIEWKNKNLTEKERKSLSLRRATSIKNLGNHIVPKKEDVKQMKIEELEKKLLEKDKLMDTLITEKELAYQKAQEWHEKYKALETEHAAVKENEVELDRLLLEEQQRNKRLSDENNKLRNINNEMSRITDPLRSLVKVLL